MRARYLVAVLVVGCGTSSSGSPSPQEAGAPDGTVTPNQEAGADGGDAGADGQTEAGTPLLPDGGCEAPVSGPCASEGATACGLGPSCSDNPNGIPTTCSCSNGQWDCGGSHCSSDLREGLGCGAGLTCEGMTITLCDGGVVEVAGRCFCASGWECVGPPAQTFPFNCPPADAGTDAP